MSDYTKIVDFAAKDALISGNPAKLVKGTEIGAEFDAISTAIATKHDAADIGVIIQAYSSNLDEYAAVNPTAAGLALLDDATAADQLTTLGGTTVGKAVFTAASVAAAQQATDTEVGVDVMAYVAPSTSGNVLTSNGSIWTSAAASATEQSLTGYYYPAAGSAYQDCYRAGFLPSWFNQQWGGAQWGTLPDGSFGSVATGNVEDNAASAIGLASGNYYNANGFKVSESATYDSIWVKLYKTGTPAQMNLRVYSDSGGVPNVALGTLAIKDGRTITSKTDGEWYQFTGLNVALTAGTQYHIVCYSGATDASNYFNWKYTTAKDYPHGNYNAGTSVPAWTPQTALATCFLIQNPAANSIIQSAGMFDYKLAFNPGTPVNQSRSVAQPLANFYDGKTCSVLYRGTYAASTNVWDFTYGIDHDRITLTINGSGYPVLTLYESDRTVATVAGTGSVTTGVHDVGIKVRTVGDGNDYLYLYVDGVSVGTPLTSQTFTMDVNMVTLGTARLGDGFGIIPAWTQDMQMTSLPSAQGWTWTGTATEANAMSVAGGKLYQNANGYTSTQTGYYTKAAPTVFVNATGWTVSMKCRVPTGTNTATADNTGLWMRVMDGTKGIDISIQEYFLRSAFGGTAKAYVQGDFKSQERVFTLCGKGSDYYLFIDGKLAIDGTGGLTDASASNNIEFGDRSATASENDDVVYSYVKYYQGGMLLPIANTGTCSEFAHWSGDKSALFPSLWNSGTPVSVKQLCGVPRNYQFEQVVQREVRRGVTSSPTSTSSGDTLIAELECYAIGSYIKQDQRLRASTAAANVAMGMTTYLDGRSVGGGSNFSASNATAGYPLHITGQAYTVTYTGLHKVEGRQATPSSTITDEARTLTVEARS